MTGPAVPPGGEELREVVRALDEWWAKHPPVADDPERTQLTRLIGRLLDLLPEMRDALAAQEKLRRVEALRSRIGFALDGPASRELRLVAADLDRALAGEP